MIETSVRDGWLVNCASCGFENRFTTLKSWGIPWVAFYSSDGKYLYINDHIDDCAEISCYEKSSILLTSLKLNFGDFSKKNGIYCSNCNEKLNFNLGNPTDLVAWSDGQILIDGKLQKVSKLEILNTTSV